MVARDIEDGERKENRAGNCGDCNRRFCLDYNLPICKGAGMEDVFTMCFRELYVFFYLPTQYVVPLLPFFLEHYFTR